MKKLLFALQVFGLIALFPLYLAAEFHHAKQANEVVKPATESKPVTPVDFPGYQKILSLSDIPFNGNTLHHYTTIN